MTLTFNEGDGWLKQFVVVLHLLLHVIVHICTINCFSNVQSTNREIFQPTLPRFRPSPIQWECDTFHCITSYVSTEQHDYGVNKELLNPLLLLRILSLPRSIFLQPSGSYVKYVYLPVSCQFATLSSSSKCLVTSSMGYELQYLVHYCALGWVI